VLGIVALLSAVLFPVFRSAKLAAEQTVCASHHRVVSQANLIYSGDYDDRFILTDQNPNGTLTSHTDRTWVQLLLPYSQEFKIFICPSDTGRTPGEDLVFDQDAVPGDLTSRYYTASMHSDIGFNFEALSPQVLVNKEWVTDPQTLAEIANPSSTVMLMDTAWAVDSNNRPYGGGSWLVDPPCRYLEAGGERIPMFGAPGYPGLPVYAASRWTTPVGPTPFGGAWPWHQGHMNVSRVDGSLRSLTPSGLQAGCDTQSGVATEGATAPLIWVSHLPSGF